MRAKRKKSNEDTNSIEDVVDSQLKSEKEYHRLKAELQKVEKEKKNKLLYLVFFIILVVTMFAIDAIIAIVAEIFKISIDDSIYEIVSIECILMVCFVSLVIYVDYEKKEYELQSRIYEYELNNAKEEAEEDIFKNSIKMSSKYLDQYYLQTKQQAQKGFFITVCVAIFGAGLIAVGIVLMFFGKVEPSYVTCASGVITEFIAAIFFYLYNRTVSSMSKYHNKLVLAQNISIALKVSDSLPEGDSAEAKKQIVTELLKDMNDHLIKDDPPTKFGK